jgi:hypothetical protein
MDGIEPSTVEAVPSEDFFSEIFVSRFDPFYIYPSKSSAG